MIRKLMPIFIVALIVSLTLSKSITSNDAEIGVQDNESQTADEAALDILSGAKLSEPKDPERITWKKLINHMNSLVNWATGVNNWWGLDTMME